jgi:hypothetical protein
MYLGGNFYTHKTNHEQDIKITHPYIISTGI